MIPQPPTSTLFPYTTLFRSITNSVVNTITVGLGPGFVAVNPKTNKIYVTLTGGCCADGNAVAVIDGSTDTVVRSEEHTSELQSHHDLVCRLLLEKKKKTKTT